MNSITEHIKIIIDSIFNSKGFTDLAKSTGKVRDIFGEQSNAISGRMAGLNKSFATQFKWLEGIATVNKKVKTKQDNFSDSVNNTRLKMIGFIFFARIMQRSLSDMLRPAAEVTGLFDIWGQALTMVFLPTMLSLQKPMLDFAVWVVDLPEPVKLLVGNIVLLTAAFVALEVAIKAIQLIQIGAGGLSLGWVGALIILIAGIWTAWQTNFGNIRDWTARWAGNIKDLVQGIWDFVSGSFDIFIGIFTLDLDKMKSGTIKVLDSLKTMFFSLADNVFVSIGSVLDSLDKVLPGAKQWGIDLITNMGKGMLDTLGWFYDIIDGLLPSWLTKIISKYFGGDTSTSNLRRIANNMLSTNPMNIVPNQPMSIMTPSYLKQGNSITMSNTYNVSVGSVSDKYEFKRLLNDYDKELNERARSSSHF